MPNYHFVHCVSGTLCECVLESNIKRERERRGEIGIERRKAGRKSDTQRGERERERDRMRQC